MKIWYCLILIICLDSVPALASKTVAEIAGRDVPLRREPYDDAPVLLLLRNGQFVIVMEESRQGYWRVQSYRGNEGWIATEYLRFGDHNETDFHRQGTRNEKDSAEAVALLKQINKHGNDLDEDRRRPRLRNPRFHRYRVQFGFGIGYSSFDEVIALTGIDEAKGDKLTALHFMVRPVIMSAWSLGLTYEKLKSADAGLGNNSDNYTVLSSVTALYLGLTYDFSIKEDWLFANFSILGGAALGGSLSFAEANTNDSSTYSGKGFAAQIRADIHLKFSYVFSFVIGGGYRLLKTAAALPVATGSGSDIVEIGGDPQALPIRFSGIFIQGGLSANF